LATKCLYIPIIKRENSPAVTVKCSIYLISFIVLCVLFFSIQTYTAWTWGLPGNESWAADSVGGYQNLVWIEKGMRYFDADGRYPPVQKYILAAVYTPITAYFILSGHLSIEDGIQTEETALKTCLLRTGRIITVLMSLGILILLFKLGSKFSNEKAGLLAAGFWIANYLVPYYSQTTNLEIPYIFWTLLALERLVSFHTSRRPSTVILSGICAALAVGTKDQAAALILVFPLMIYRSPFKPNPSCGNSDTNNTGRIILLWLATCLSLYLILSQLVFRPGNYWDSHIQLIFGDAMINYQVDMSQMVLLKHHLRSFAELAHPLVISILVVGSIGLILFSTRLWLWIFLPLISYQILFLMGSRLYFSRFMIVHFTFLALTAGIMFSHFFKRKQILSCIGILICVSFAYTSSLPVNWYLWNDIRKNADEWLKARPYILSEIGTYCVLEGFLPVEAQKTALKIFPENGYPKNLGTKYVLCTKAWYSQFMKNDELKQAWQDTIFMSTQYTEIKSFHSKPIYFLGTKVIDRELGIPGLGQPITILGRVSE